MKKTTTKNSQMSNTLDEAQPVGALSRAGNWLKSQLPTFAPGTAATARGAKPTGNKANAMKLQYQEWLGSVGENPTQENLLSWLKSNNFPTSAADKIFAGSSNTSTAAGTSSTAANANPPTATGTSSPAAGTSSPAAGTSSPAASPTTSNAPSPTALLANLKQQYPNVPAMLSALQRTQDPKAKAVVNNIKSNNPTTINDVISILQQSGQLKTVDQMLAGLQQGNAAPAQPNVPAPVAPAAKTNAAPLQTVDQMLAGLEKGNAAPTQPNAPTPVTPPVAPKTAPKMTAKKRAAESESEKMRRFMSFLNEDTAIDDKMVNQVILAVARDMARSGTALTTNQPTGTQQSTTATTPSTAQTASQAYSPSDSQGGSQVGYQGGSQSEYQGTSATMSATQLIKAIKNMEIDEKRAFFKLLLANPSYKKYIEKMLRKDSAPVPAATPTTTPSTIP